MKRICVLAVLFFALVFTLGAESITIGLVASNQGSGAQARASNKIEELCEQQGWELFVSNAAGSWERMNNLVENYVSRRVDAIIIAMGKANSLSSSLRAADRAGIPVIGIDSEYSDLLTADILTNNWEMGAKISTYMVDRLNHEGDIIVFKFDQFYGTRYRGKVLDSILTEEPNINVLEVHHLPPSGFVEDAQRTMQSYLLKYGNEIDAVWCPWDDPAYGASLAIKARGLDQDDIFVVGLDGNDRNLQLIQSGGSPVAATIVQPFEASAARAIDLIKKIVVQGRSPEQVIGAVKVLYMDTPLVTGANASDYLE